MLTLGAGPAGVSIMPVIQGALSGAPAQSFVGVGGPQHGDSSSVGAVSPQQHDAGSLEEQTVEVLITCMLLTLKTHMTTTSQLPLSITLIATGVRIHKQARSIRQSK